MPQALSQAVSMPALTSQIASTHDAFMQKPQYLLQMFRSLGDQGLQFYKYILAQNAEIPVAGEQFSHWEEAAYTKYLTAGATAAAPGAGNTMTLTLSADDVTAGGLSYLREDNVIENLDNGAQYIVRTKLSNTQFTIAPVLGTTNFSITTGNEFQVIGFAYEEGTAQPTTAFSFQTKYDFNMQIIKDTAAITGTEKTQELWVTSDNTGTQFTGYWSRVLMQAEYRMIQYEYNHCFWQVPGTNAGASTMNGLWYEMSEDGAARSYNLPVTGNLDMGNLNNINYALQEEYYFGPIYAWLSRTRYGQINADLTTEFQDVNIARVNREVQEYFWDGIEGETRDTLAATMDYKSITQEGRTFSFQLCWALNDPSSGRLQSARSQAISFFLPLGGATTPSGFVQKYTSLRYKVLGDYNRRREVWRDGSAHNGLKIGPNDLSYMYFRSHIGFQTFMLNRAAIIDGTNS